MSTLTDTRTHVVKLVRDLAVGDVILPWEDGTPFGPWEVTDLFKRPLADEWDIYTVVQGGEWRDVRYKVAGGDVRKVASSTATANETGEWA